MNGIDILAIGAHPDDVELGCGGTLAAQVKAGCKVVICDLSEGESGTRGTAEERRAESREAAEILGVAARFQMCFPDARIGVNMQQEDSLVVLIRALRPKIVLCNAPHDRHPDHGQANRLVRSAAFKAGLGGLQVSDFSSAGLVYRMPDFEVPDWYNHTPWRPEQVWSYIQAYGLDADFVVDMEEFFELKMKAILAHRSQFYNPEREEPETLISSPQFLEFIKARCLHFGIPSGINMAEGFVAERPPVVHDLRDLH
jgi:bacillithiol biosynthesis deacetylase BshB1